MYLLLLVLGVIEAFVTHVISDEELKKIGYKKIDSEVSTPLWINYCFLGSFVVWLVLAFVDPVLTCYCLPFVFAFAIPNVVEFVVNNKKKWIY